MGMGVYWWGWEWHKGGSGLERRRDGHVSGMRGDKGSSEYQMTGVIVLTGGEGGR